MKASELIKELTKLVEKHGDLEVRSYNYCGDDWDWDPILSVYFSKDDKAFNAANIEKP